MAEIKSILEETGLSEYLNLLIDKGYERISDILLCKEYELVSYGLKEGHAKRLLQAIKRTDNKKRKIEDISETKSEVEENVANVANEDIDADTNGNNIDGAFQIRICSRGSRKQKSILLKVYKNTSILQLKTVLTNTLPIEVQDQVISINDIILNDDILLNDINDLLDSNTILIVETKKNY